MAISAYDAQSLECYQIKGIAQHVIEGKLVDTFKAMVEKCLIEQPYRFVI